MQVERESMFNRCTGCGYLWSDREKFLADPTIKIIGYQIDFEDLDSGFFMFNHLSPKCLSTIGIPVRVFRDLYEGEIFSGRQTGSLKCLGYCLHRDNLEPCSAKCECSFVREVVQIVLRWPKDVAA